MKRIAALVLSCTVLAGGSLALAQGGPQLGKWGFDLTGMDTSVRPGDNFFEYANGNWVKTAVIPADRSGTGSFQTLRVESDERLKTIVADLGKKPRADLSPEETKLRDLYDAFIDTAAIEAGGLKSAQKDLDYFGGLNTLDDVARAMASARLSTASVYDIGVGVDPKNPDNYSVDLSQGGLGLPDREYYLSPDAAMVKTREDYRKYLADMMGLAGLSDAAARADRVLALETEIAKVSWARADRRDVDKTYNPMTVPQLKALAPEFRWDAFLAETHIPMTTAQGNPRYVIVAENTAFPALAKIFAATPVSTWRDYLTVHYLHTFAAYLPKKFDDTNFAFYGTAISGNPQQLDRATRAVHVLDGAMGEALGKIYVARYFPPESKAKMDRLVANLLKAYEADIKTLAWMTPATRQRALDKLHLFTPKIGYPEKWRDYSALTVVRGDPLGNAQQATLFEWNRELARINKPVDKSEWEDSPQTVNAFYSPSSNQILFPAAFLQPPFFDPKADDAVNYGGIGSVIGHEISHGFDDQGSKRDGTGKLEDWWSKEDRAAYDARTTALVAQYGTYEVLPGLHVIGRQTLGENIGDNAGIAIAYKAYHMTLGGKPAPVLDGLTGDQRFFLGFAQNYRTKTRESFMRYQTVSDVHTVDRYRVIGVPRNMDQWYDAFHVTPDEKYYLPPDQRVHLW
jgi:putative endopeptidase